jgi:hypothetical protein
LLANRPSYGTTGIWTVIGGTGTFSYSTLCSTNVTNIGLGANTFRWTVTGYGCTAFDDVTITNNMVTATAGSDQVTCQNSIYLAGDAPAAGGYGIWSRIGGSAHIVTPTAYNTLVVGLGAGINTFIWTVYENGCNNGGDIMTVTNNQFSAYAGPDMTLEPLIFNTFLYAMLPAGGNGLWTVTSGSGTFANPSLPNTEVTSISTGVNTYTWTVYANGCSDSDDVNINIQACCVNPGLDQTIFEDNTQMAATNIPGAELQEWSVVSGTGTFVDIHDAVTQVNNISYGDNIYQWKVVKNGFISTVNVTIYRTVSAGTDITLTGDTVNLSADLPAGATGPWSVVYGTGTIENDVLPQTRAWDLSPGINTFRWTVTFAGKLSVYDDITVTKIVTGVEETEQQKIRVYPNPSNGLVYIETKLCPQSVSVFNNIGVQISPKCIKSPTQTVYDFSPFGIGVYFIRVQTDKTVSAYKIVIQK